MSKRIFTVEQIKDLSQNKSVVRCSERSITYDQAFKIMAVRRYLEDGLPARQIFDEAGLPVSVVGLHAAQDCLGDWVRIFKAHGVGGLNHETRGRGGGRPRTKGVTDADTIKRLEATVAYLKAENHFLAKLRAKRAE